MTDREINIAIAEFCGWKPSNPKGMWCHPSNWSLAKSGSYYVWVGYDKLPNYVEDLNAMHEAENTVIRPARLWYQYCLKLPGRSFDESIGATARERAETFLKILNNIK